MLTEKARMSINTFRDKYTIDIVGRGGAFVSHKQQLHMFLVIPVGRLAREACGGTGIRKTTLRSFIS